MVTQLISPKYAVQIVSLMSCQINLGLEESAGERVGETKQTNQRIMGYGAV
jgi:hypothetical protein